MEGRSFWSFICHLCVAISMLKLYDILYAFTEEPPQKAVPASIFNSVGELSLQLGSSVWCFGGERSSRICKFRNLCYDPEHDEYIFFHGTESILDGVPHNRFEPALLDLSSVDDHNTQYFNYVDFLWTATSAKTYRNVTFVDGMSLLFHRLNPDNIMHVIHDDLLPLYHTLKQFSCEQDLSLDWRLILMEGRGAGEYFDLYKLFSSKTPLLKTDILASNRLTCFQHSVVGISKFTTWYQYGFKKPQGPLPKISVTGSQIRKFNNFVRMQLKIRKPSDVSASSYLVLYSRRHNRLILNELDLALSLAAKFNMQVMQVSMESHTLREQIELISQARALIGIHGSALILSMFLPPGAVLMELFPFGINPEHYTPYCTLAKLPGIGLSYVVWRNMIESNSVVYPDRPADVGGIQHLSKEEQRLIKSTKEIPQHHCCSDPYWLYRIYQDTIVDIPSLLQTMDLVLANRNTLNAKVPEVNYYKLIPARVRNITCNGSVDFRQPSLSLSWRHPINYNFFEVDQLKYEVWIQEKGRDEYAAYLLDVTQYVFTESLKKETEYNVWIRCLVNDDQPGAFGEMKMCKTL